MLSSLDFTGDDFLFPKCIFERNITIMKNTSKYRPLYYMPPEGHTDWIHQDKITKAPIWCSVDLRDGNQALITPMSLVEKLAYFDFLLKIGFKEIEVGFPAASETEFAFLRTLIEDNLIPDDVTIQVLTQSRAHIIEQTFKSVKGAKQAVIHLYNSTSQAQREQVFKLSEDEIVAIAIEGAELFNQHAAQMPETKFTFEYSPESFTGTEPEYALRVCNAVLDVWKPDAVRKAIINLPATVETSMPHVYAQQVAYMSQNLHYRENVIVSIHPHNDRGTGVAAAEMALLAGADRVEGTLFGNGERTGNVDIVTLALNLYTHGVSPELDLSDMPYLTRTFEEATDLPIGPRHPYAGQLVFAAFSGSHQDAIAKGLDFRKTNDTPHWTVPYLPIDPSDVSREYESDVIRINSQSGGGGIAYILEQNFGYNLPKELRREVGGYIKSISDRDHKELTPDEVYEAFKLQYINVSAPIGLERADWRREGDHTIADVKLIVNGEAHRVEGKGNGSLDAVSDALKKVNLKINLHLTDYMQHAIEHNSDARAAAYVKLSDNNDQSYWGIGVHNDIATASALALVSALNREVEATES